MRSAKFLIVVLLLVGCMPGSGPGPNAVLVVDATASSLGQVIAAVDSVKPRLDDRIDKRRDFPLYESAFWYPQDGSSIFGVGIVRWSSDLKGEGSAELKNRFFVEVYAPDHTCSLCTAVRSSLTEHKVPFFSACDHPDTSTHFEKVRCGIQAANP